MKIVVSYKCVPTNDQIEVKGDKTLDLSKAEWEIGEFDLNAAEAAAQLVEAHGGTAVALMANTPAAAGNTKLKKGILSRGMAEQFAIVGECFAEADSLTTAKALKAGVEKIGDVDLVLCGEGSGDMYTQQVGNTLGVLLGWTTLNAVSKIEYADGALKVERAVADGTESLTVNLPAVISVTSDINLPRFPSFKEIMAAGKKPSTSWALNELMDEPTPAYETVSVLAPEQTDRKKIIMEGTDDETVDAFIDLIKKSF